MTVSRWESADFEPSLNELRRIRDEARFGQTNVLKSLLRSHPLHRRVVRHTVHGPVGHDDGVREIR